MDRFVVSVVAGISLAGIYSLIALGVVLIFRATATFNFAQGQLMLLPAFVLGSWQATHGGPVWVPLALGLALNVLIGVGFYFGILQRTVGLSPFMGVIATLGLGFVLDGVMVLWFDSPQYAITFPSLPDGVITVLGVRVSEQSLIVTAISLALSVIVLFWLRLTSLGRRIRAAGQDAVLASQGGINVRLLYAGSWALAAVLAGVAGVLYGTTNIVEPSMAMVAFAVFPAIMIGGLDSLEGAVLGSLIVGLAQGFVATYLGSRFLEGATYSVLLLAMLWMPQGILGTRHVSRV